MKKKTTWAASVVKKQLQTCCKHQTFSLETTERDDTSQGFGSPLRVIHISSPIKKASNPVLLRRKSFNVSHARSLLTTPEPLTPFRKSVESAVPLCRSSTNFKSTRLQNVKSSPDLTAEKLPPTEAPPKGKVMHKSGPLPVLQQLLRGSHLQGGISSPLNVRKQLSGPLLSVPRKPLSGSPSPNQPLLPAPSFQRLSKVQFSPTPHEIAANGKLAGMIAEEADSPPNTPINPISLRVKAKQQLTPVLDKKCSRESDRASKTEHCYPTPSSPDVIPVAIVMTPPTELPPSELQNLGKNASAHPLQCGFNLEVKDQINTKRSSAAGSLDADCRFSAAVKIQAAYRGYQARNRGDSEQIRRRRCNSDLNEDHSAEEDSAEALAPSISTQMSRTDPQRQKRNPPPRTMTRGWNGSIRSALDHQALLRNRQEAALKRERAMEYALSRQRWRTLSRPGTKPVWCTDDRVPDKPNWVRNWLDRAARMSSVQNAHTHLAFDHHLEQVQDDPQSESLSVKSTVGICTTDIGSVEVNLGWPLSLRQQHAAGLLQSKSPIPEPAYIINNGGVALKRDSEENFSLTSTSDDETPANDEIESSGRHLGCDIADLESVGSCEGPMVPHKFSVSPVVAAKPRRERRQKKMTSNSNSGVKLEAAKRDCDRVCGALRPQSQVSVALSDGNSVDTTAASVQRPLWR